MHDLSLYEKKIINDEEFPVQMFVNHINWTGSFFPSHWHEHIELHYIFKGQGIFYLNQKPYFVDEGSLVIINSNELHLGVSNSKYFEASANVCGFLTKSITKLRLTVVPETISKI